MRALARPGESDLKLVLVLIQGSNKRVQGKILAKGIEAQQLGQQLQGALAHYGCLVLQPACACEFNFGGEGDWMHSDRTHCTRCHSLYRGSEQASQDKVQFKAHSTAYATADSDDHSRAIPCSTKAWCCPDSCTR